MKRGEVTHHQSSLPRAMLHVSAARTFLHMILARLEAE
jgi:hypothetical protein